MVNQMAAIQYCLEVTSGKMDYRIIFQNCQKFAKEIIIRLVGDMKLSQKTPFDAEEGVKGVTFLSAIAMGSVSLAAAAGKTGNRIIESAVLYATM